MDLSLPPSGTVLLPQSHLATICRNDSAADNIGCLNILSRIFNSIILTPITPELKRNYCGTPKIWHWREVTFEVVKRSRAAVEQTFRDREDMGSNPVECWSSSLLFTILTSSGSLIMSLVEVLRFLFLYFKNMIGCAGWGEASLISADWAKKVGKRN